MNTYTCMNMPVRFGLELEHDSSPSYDIDALASALYTTGYGNNKIAYGHRSAAGRVFYVHDRGWLTEFDESVSGGEVISPAMVDSLETWIALDTVLTVIKEQGGTAKTEQSSFHIHMDTSHLANDYEKWEALYSYLEHFSEVLFAIGTHPIRGKHRGEKQCLPVKMNPADTVEDFRKQYTKATLMMNTRYVRENGYGHVEYRVNDASLDYALMRAQVLVLGRLMMLAGDKVKAPVSNDTGAFYEFIVRPGDEVVLSAINVFRGLDTKDHVGHALPC